MQLFRRSKSLGIEDKDTESLIRISNTLRRWSERECGVENGHIERDEKTDKPFFVFSKLSYADGSPRKYAINDMESGALKKLSKIMAEYPDLISYHQTDPRGCALYIGRKSDIPKGVNIDSVYSSYLVGFCVD